jgi:signal transduction histidine kinase
MTSRITRTSPQSQPAERPSTGLGLSIVERIVDLHGGTVTAETAGPTGTAFMKARDLADAK